MIQSFDCHSDSTVTQTITLPFPTWELRFVSRGWVGASP